MLILLLAIVLIAATLVAAAEVRLVQPMHAPVLRIAPSRLAAARHAIRTRYSGRRRPPEQQHVAMPAGPPLRQQPAIEPVAGMRVLSAHGRQARHGADASAGHDVARPMHVVKLA